MKKYVALLVLSLIGISLQAQKQKIKLKNDQVLVDGVHVMDYSELNGGKSGCTLRVKGTDEDDVLIKWAEYEFKDDHYTVFHFFKYDITVEISRYGTNKGYIKRLLEEGVINENWQFDMEKIELFHTRYHEGISN